MPDDRGAGDAGADNEFRRQMSQLHDQLRERRLRYAPPDPAADVPAAAPRSPRRVLATASSSLSTASRRRASVSSNASVDVESVQRRVAEMRRLRSSVLLSTSSTLGAGLSASASRTGSSQQLVRSPRRRSLSNASAAPEAMATTGQGDGSDAEDASRQLAEFRQRLSRRRSMAMQAISSAKLEQQERLDSLTSLVATLSTQASGSEVDAPSASTASATAASAAPRRGPVGPKRRASAPPGRAPVILEPVREHASGHAHSHDADDATRTARHSWDSDDLTQVASPLLRTATEGTTRPVPDLRVDVGPAVPMADSRSAPTSARTATSLALSSVGAAQRPVDTPTLQRVEHAMAEAKAKAAPRMLSASSPPRSHTRALLSPTPQPDERADEPQFQARVEQLFARTLARATSPRHQGCVPVSAEEADAEQQRQVKQRVVVKDPTALFRREMARLDEVEARRQQLRQQREAEELAGVTGRPQINERSRRMKRRGSSALTAYATQRKERREAARRVQEQEARARAAAPHASRQSRLLLARVRSDVLRKPVHERLYETARQRRGASAPASAATRSRGSDEGASSSVRVGERLYEAAKQQQVRRREAEAEAKRRAEAEAKVDPATGRARFQPDTSPTKRSAFRADAASKQGASLPVEQRLLEHGAQAELRRQQRREAEEEAAKAAASARKISERSEQLSRQRANGESGGDATTTVQHHLFSPIGNAKPLSFDEELAQKRQYSFHPEISERSRRLDARAGGKQGLDRLNSLLDKAREVRERKEAARQAQARAELAECMKKPQRKLTPAEEEAFIQRNKTWIKAKQVAVFAKQQQQWMHELDECTFKPTITTSPPPQPRVPLDGSRGGNRSRASDDDAGHSGSRCDSSYLETFVRRTAWKQTLADTEYSWTSNVDVSRTNRSPERNLPPSTHHAGCVEAGDANGSKPGKADASPGARRAVLGAKTPPLVPLRTKARKIWRGDEPDWPQMPTSALQLADRIRADAAARQRVSSGTQPSVATAVTLTSPGRPPVQRRLAFEQPSVPPSSRQVKGVAMDLIWPGPAATLSSSAPSSTPVTAPTSAALPPGSGTVITADALIDSLARRY